MLVCWGGAPWASVRATFALISLHIWLSVIFPPHSKWHITDRWPRFQVRCFLRQLTAAVNIFHRLTVTLPYSFPCVVSKVAPIGSLKCYRASSIPCPSMTLLILPTSLVAQMLKNLPAMQCRRPRFDPWVRKIPWRRDWPPTPAFLPREFLP